MMHKTSTLAWNLDSTVVSISVDILVELTNTAFVNSTNITINLETAALSTLLLIRISRHCGAKSVYTAVGWKSSLYCRPRLSIKTPTLEI